MVEDNALSGEGLFQPAWNFLGLPAERSRRENARGWILPIPYESTTSYGAGTRDGPAAIIAASRQVELYDRYLACEPAMQYGIHTMDPLAILQKSPDAMARLIEEAVFRTLSSDPGPEVLGVLGGEHTISAGVARGLARAVAKDSLVCVHIDAHADLRDEYEGSPFSHACAARRILDVCPVFQIAIRNISEGEDEFRRRCSRVKTFFSDDPEFRSGAYLRELARFVKGRDVFLTIDLDGLDPSIMPAVGTPEPDGMSWAQALDTVSTVVSNARRVPVFDVVELAPIPGFRSPDFLAASLVYKIFTSLLMRDSKKKTKRRG